MDMMPIHLMLIAADAESLAVLRARVDGREDCAVTGTAGPDDDLAAAMALADPDVVLWDVGDDPEAALQHLPDERGAGVPIVAIVQDERDGVRALALGASGLLPRDAGADSLVLAARAAAGGLLALDPSVAGLATAREREDDAPAETLTARERDVLGLMAQGLPNKLIADRLGITEHTAKFHVHAILGKLGTQSRTEAVVRAARLGLVAI
jgi:two-component system, NarL family, nitrate/nitrite response regulator NarL